MKNAAMKRLLIHQNADLREALGRMDRGGMGILFVVDEQQKLLGLLTDGDVRRALIRGFTLNSSVVEMMNKDFTSWNWHRSREEAVLFMRTTKCRQLPIINDKRQLVDIILMDELEFLSKENPVVLMVGGLGTRLRPLTNNVPKPMLKMGDKPFLEHILENFVGQGFHNFYFCVNYLAKQIEDYFSNGSAWGAEIYYIYEQKRMGTAGALTLIPDVSDLPLVVMNGDLLTKVDFNVLLDHHIEQRCLATMCVHRHEYQVPYGVVGTDGLKITGITEKPVQSYLVNAGVYVIEPQCIERIPKNEYYDMPALFNNLLKEGLPASIFPIHEYWIDIGKLEEYEKAKVILQGNC